MADIEIDTELSELADNYFRAEVNLKSCQSNLTEDQLVKANADRKYNASKILFDKAEVHVKNCENRLKNYILRNHTIVNSINPPVIEEKPDEKLDMVRDQEREP